MQLSDLRTIPELKAESPPEGAVQRLSDRVLRAAAENPDHSAGGRAAAAAELAARGAAPARWRVAAQGFVTAADLRSGARLFFSGGRALRVWSGRLVYLSLLALIALTAWAWFATSTHQWRAGRLIAMAWAPPLGAVVLLAAVVWLFASALRRKPARVVVLRSSGTRALARPLERMLRDELRPYGHVVSMSDRFARQDAMGWLQLNLLSLTNPLAAIWFLVGLPVRLLVRIIDRSAMGPALVLNARDYRNLAKRLRDRIGLNLQSALLAKEALDVRASQKWSRTAARLLIDSGDVIVVDLSEAGESPIWQLELVRDEHALARCVFVALWGRAEAAQTMLARADVDAPCFYYAPDGEMQRRSQFRAALLAAMRATHRVPV